MTKRPLAAIGFIYLIVLAVAVCLASVINLTLAVMAAVIGIAAVFVMRDYRAQVLLITIPFSLGFGVMSVCQCSAENINERLGENTCAVIGEVTEIPKMQYGRWYYVIETSYIGLDSAPQNVKIRLTCRNSIEAREGDIVSGQVTFIRGNDESGYDSETALRADGIQARAWCSPYIEMDVMPGSAKLRYLPLKIRRAVTEAIRDSIPDKYSGMLCAMLLGDTSYLDDETADNFRSTGIAHLLAVSGLHVSLLTYCVMDFLKKLRLPVKLSLVITILFVLMFMAVTGFSPSVTRAGVMHIMSILARLAVRDADNITSMSLSLLIMCILNPWSAADIGLQMSVSSTLGLIFVADRLNRNLKRALNIGHFGFVPKLKSYIVESLAVSVTASVCTMPLSAVYFGKVSLIAPLSNVLCVYAATNFIMLGIVAVILSQIPLIGWLLGFIPKLAVTLLGIYIDAVTGLLAGVPLSSVNSGYDYVAYFFLFSGAVLIVAYASARKLQNRDFTGMAAAAAFCAVSALLLVSMISHRLTSMGGEIIIFGMQEGGVCVCAKNETHAVIGEAGGSSYDFRELQDVLSKEGVQSIDAVAVSENSEKRGTLADDLIEKYNPDYFACEGGDGEYAHALKAAEICGTDVLDFGGKISLDELDLSLEMYIDSDGKRWQMLSSGDTSVLICPTAGNCAMIPENFRACDVVVIGDSDVKNTIYLTAGAAVVTAEYGEADQIAARLRVKGFQNVYMTCDKGTIKCRVKGGKLYIGSY
ncbi:MAG: ComEC/Rec2 family competence protein [Acutalibacteraceae bacterium]